MKRARLALLVVLAGLSYVGLITLIEPAGPQWHGPAPALLDVGVDAVMRAALPTPQPIVLHPSPPPSSAAGAVKLLLLGDGRVRLDAQDFALSEFDRIAATAGWTRDTEFVIQGHHAHFFQDARALFDQLRLWGAHRVLIDASAP